VGAYSSHSGSPRAQAKGTRHSSPFRPIAADGPWCNNGPRCANRKRPQETFMLLAVSNYRSREAVSVRLG
jgi:hypothetical protein